MKQICMFINLEWYIKINLNWQKKLIKIYDNSLKLEFIIRVYTKKKNKKIFYLGN